MDFGKNISFVIVAPVIALSACGKVNLDNGSGGNTLLMQAELVREQSSQVCKFAPSVTSIAAILGVPGAPLADELVDAICDQINEIPELESTGTQPRNVIIELPQGPVDGVLNPQPES